MCEKKHLLLKPDSQSLDHQNPHKRHMEQFNHLWSLMPLIEMGGGDRENFRSRNVT